MNPFQWLLTRAHRYGIRSCENKAQSLAHPLRIRTMVNVGAGRECKRWSWAETCDGQDSLSPDGGEGRGEGVALDFNTHRLPWPDQYAELVICEQVIEHLHNTTWFLSELHRITSPGGHLLLATENLASLPNLFALALQKAPFSMQPVCGRFIGGWRDREATYTGECPPNHPAHSGLRGHVRVLTVGQLKELLRLSGFQILSKHGYLGNHYVLIHGRRNE